MNQFDQIFLELLKFEHGYFYGVLFWLMLLFLTFQIVNFITFLITKQRGIM